MINDLLKINLTFKKGVYKYFLQFDVNIFIFNKQKHRKTDH